MSHIQSPIVISDDDDDEEEAIFQRDVQRAIQASKSSHGSGSSTMRQDPPPFISERAAMERERLARQKRLRKEAGLDNDDNDDLSTKRQHLPSPPIPTSTSDQIFWEGEVRQIANKHAEPREDGRPTFRLTDILGKKSDIAFAILSSYSLALSWIYQFFDPITPVIIVAHDPDRPEELHNVFPNWVRTVPKLVNGRGCMHMKFMLIWYKTGRLRIVISTANLIDIDWRDIENTAWVQDIPRRSSAIPHDPKITDDFPSIMQYVLQKTYVRPALRAIRLDRPDIPIESIENLRTHWDFTKVKTKLVPSIAGKHEGWPLVLLSGHLRLMKAVRDMGLRTGKGKGKNIALEYQGSSIGNYSTQWMNEFHWSARGESAEDWLDIKKAHREKAPYPPIKIIFPSNKTVKNSVLGEPGGGTMFCSRRQWSFPKFPRESFYDSNSKGGRVLMHSKIIIALTQDEKKPNEQDSDDDEIIEILEDDENIGWAYIGSHNFTPSAWGTLSGSSFNPIMNITNYELGVVFPLKDHAMVDKVACWQRPPRKYTSDDVPWIQEEGMI